MVIFYFLFSLNNFNLEDMNWIFFTLIRSTLEFLSTSSMLPLELLTWTCMFSTLLLLVSLSSEIKVRYYYKQAATCKSRCMSGTFAAPTRYEPFSYSASDHEFILISHWSSPSGKFSTDNLSAKRVCLFFFCVTRDVLFFYLGFRWNFGFGTWNSSTSN